MCKTYDLEVFVGHRSPTAKIRFCCNIFCEGIVGVVKTDRNWASRRDSENLKNLGCQNITEFYLKIQYLHAGSPKQRPHLGVSAVVQLREPFAAYTFPDRCSEITSGQTPPILPSIIMASLDLCGGMASSRLRGETCLALQRLAVTPYWSRGVCRHTQQLCEPPLL